MSENTTVAEIRSATIKITTCGGWRFDRRIRDQWGNQYIPREFRLLWMNAYSVAFLNKTAGIIQARNC